MAYDEKLANRIRAVFVRRADMEEKRMFGGLAFMLRGRMCCGIVGSTLMVRLDPAIAEDLLHEAHARPMDFTGRPMRGFLFVDPPGIARGALLRKWLDRATKHVESLPEKAKNFRSGGCNRPSLRAAGLRTGKPGK